MTATRVGDPGLLAVLRGLARMKVDTNTIDAFTKEAMSGDYDKVIQAYMKYVNAACCNTSTTQENDDE